MESIIGSTDFKLKPVRMEKMTWFPEKVQKYDTKRMMPTDWELPS
jgi:hypothetical protein